MKKILLSFYLLGFAIPLKAQIPGTWEKHLVCTHCTLYNVLSELVRSLDFADSLHGMLVGGDDEFLSNNGHNSRVYLTSDGGISWIKHVDSNNSTLRQLQSFT